MKPVRKYTTFEKLKSIEEKVVDYRTSIKKHNEFERVIKSIRSEKVLKNVIDKSK